MTKRPFFSIIIPTYNRANFIADTIQSVLDQTFPYWECIIVDDGSTDNTKEIVNKINDKRVRYYWKKNEERSVARNYGIKKAKGKYICFLDSDDYYKSNHLCVLYNSIKHTKDKIGMFYTRMEKQIEGKKKDLVTIYNSKEYNHPVHFLKENFLLINSICIHHTILNKYKFPEKFNIWEDTHLWFRILANYPFYQIPQVTTGWVIHSNGSVSKNFAKVKIRSLKMYLDCISDLEKNHYNELNGLLTKNDFANYKFKKYKLLLDTAANNYQFITFHFGIIFGLKYFNPNIIINYYLKKGLPFSVKYIKTRLRNLIHKIYNSLN
jgi:glycosyltransferase involved in cell wall biosynthesis